MGRSIFKSLLSYGTYWVTLVVEPIVLSQPHLPLRVTVRIKDVYGMYLKAALSTLEEGWATNY